MAVCGVAAAAAAWPGEAARARLLYIQYCSGCHLPDGSGSPATGIPSLRAPMDALLAVPGGREFLAQVPGVMNSGLNDADVARVMNWLLVAFADGVPRPRVQPYAAAEIARLRATRPQEIMAVRAALVAASGTPPKR